MANIIFNKTICISIKNVVFIVLTIVLLLYCSIRFCKERYIKSPISDKAVESVLSQFEYVESIQIYEYKFMPIHKCEQIKIDFKTGIAKENIDINSVLQLYYNIPYSIFKKISVFKKFQTKYRSEKHTEDRELANSAGKDLCSDIIESLNKLNSARDIGIFHYEMYRILSVIMPAIEEKSCNSFLSNEEIERQLAGGKRTGLIGPIILNDVYVFKNQNSNKKKDRLYMAFPLQKDDNTIVLVSLNNNYFTDKDIGKK